MEKLIYEYRCATHVNEILIAITQQVEHGYQILVHTIVYVR